MSLMEAIRRKNYKKVSRVLSRPIDRSEVYTCLRETVTLNDSRLILKIIFAYLDEPIATTETFTGDLLYHSINRNAHHRDLSNFHMLLGMGANVNPRLVDVPPITCVTGGTYTERSYRKVIEIVRLLLDRGMDPNLKFRYGDTNLRPAIIYGSIEMVEMLLDAGASIETCDTRGDSPLFYAIMYFRSNIVDVLIDRGACITNILKHPSISTLYRVCESLGMLSKLVMHGAIPSDRLVAVIDAMRQTDRDIVNTIFSYPSSIYNRRDRSKTYMSELYCDISIII